MAVKSKAGVSRTILQAQRDLDKFERQIGKNSRVQVGIPANSRDYPDGTSVILVGLVHEFGSLSRNIPERSYLRAGIRKNSKKYVNLFAKLAIKVLNGDTTVKQGLGIIGLQAASDVQQELTELQRPPLKHRVGNPLVDTGHLRQSITFQVKEIK